MPAPTAGFFGVSLSGVIFTPAAELEQIFL
jgi:hypothetical protein